MNPIQDFIFELLPPETKHRNNGWYYYNCKSCHNFELPDKKMRGNILFEGENIVYQCFNCKLKWVWTPDSGIISKNMYLWLKDMGLTAAQIAEFKTICQQFCNNATPSENNVIKKREIRTIPAYYKSIQKSLEKKESNQTLQRVVRYLNLRNPELLKWGELMWANNQNHFLIPCYEYGNIVGYSLRKLNDEDAPKYIHYIPSGYIFNFDNLLKDRKYQIICEGQTDALAINGISILSNTFTPDRLKRILPFTEHQELILLPDRDKAGQKMVKQCLDNDLPFSVAFPNWDKGIKDAEDAVKKFGRLYTIYSILTSRERDKNLIKMKAMKWFSL